MLACMQAWHAHHPACRLTSALLWLPAQYIAQQPPQETLNSNGAAAASVNANKGQLGTWAVPTSNQAAQQTAPGSWASQGSGPTLTQPMADGADVAANSLGMVSAQLPSPPSAD